MGKLGLKLVFWKNISSHTHTFLFLILNALRYVFKNQVIFLKRFFFFFFFQIFDWSNLIFDLSKSFWKILVSLCLVRLIELVFDQSNIVNQVFKKLSFDLFKHLFKTFQIFFSLSPTRQGSTDIFLSFSSKILAKFLSP